MCLSIHAGFVCWMRLNVGFSDAEQLFSALYIIPSSMFIYIYIYAGVVADVWVRVNARVRVHNIYPNLSNHCIT